MTLASKRLSKDARAIDSRSMETYGCIADPETFGPFHLIGGARHWP